MIFSLNGGEISIIMDKENFYKNNINVNIDEFLHFKINNFDTLPRQNFRSLQERRVIVPIGGGKDSIVTLELLKNQILRLSH